MSGAWSDAPSSASDFSAALLCHAGPALRSQYPVAVRATPRRAAPQARSINFPSKKVARTAPKGSGGTGAPGGGPGGGGGSGDRRRGRRRKRRTVPYRSENNFGSSSDVPGVGVAGSAAATAARQRDDGRRRPGWLRPGGPAGGGGSRSGLGAAGIREYSPTPAIPPGREHRPARGLIAIAVAAGVRATRLRSRRPVRPASAATSRAQACPPSRRRRSDRPGGSPRSPRPISSRRRSAASAVEPDQACSSRSSTVSTHSVSSRRVRQGTAGRIGLLLQASRVGQDRPRRRARRQAKSR